MLVEGFSLGERSLGFLCFVFFFSLKNTVTYALNQDQGSGLNPQAATSHLSSLPQPAFLYQFHPRLYQQHYWVAYEIPRIVVTQRGWHQPQRFFLDLEARDVSQDTGRSLQVLRVRNFSYHLQKKVALSRCLCD